MKIKNIILGRYNEIQTEIWVGVAYFWPKLDSTQLRQNSLLQKVLKFLFLEHFEW